jgi:hypothetical protein
MSGVTLKDGKMSKELRERLSVVSVRGCVRTG